MTKNDDFGIYWHGVNNLVIIIGSNYRVYEFAVKLCCY